MQTDKATTFGVAHSIAARVAHFIALPLAHQSRYWHRRILTTFPVVSETYLMTGCGEVLRGQGNPYFSGMLPFAPVEGIPQSILEGLLAEQEVLHRRLNQIDQILARLTGNYIVERKRAC